MGLASESRLDLHIRVWVESAYPSLSVEATGYANRDPL